VTQAKGLSKVLGAFRSSLALLDRLSLFQSSMAQSALIAVAQPKAGTGHKMQSVPFVFERYIVRDISLTYFWKCSLAH